MSDSQHLQDLALSARSPDGGCHGRTQHSPLPSPGVYFQPAQCWSSCPTAHCTRQACVYPDILHHGPSTLQVWPLLEADRGTVSLLRGYGRCHQVQGAGWASSPGGAWPGRQNSQYTMKPGRGGTGTKPHPVSQIPQPTCRRPPAGQVLPAPLPSDPNVGPAPLPHGPAICIPLLLPDSGDLLPTSLCCPATCPVDS